MEIILNKNIDNNTNGIYLRHLIDQYMDATGIKCLPTNNERLKKEITEWLKERDSLTDTYKMLLDCMDIEYNHPMTAEVGKGFQDTIVYNNNTTIITPYPNNLERNIKNKIINASLQISCQNANLPPTPLPKIDHLMTENPYTRTDINNWEYIFNDSNIYATIGVFGRTYDKDKDKKIKMLKEFKERIIDTTYKEQYYRLKDEYGYVITKARKFK